MMINDNGVGMLCCGARCANLFDACGGGHDQRLVMDMARGYGRRARCRGCGACGRFTKRPYGCVYRC